MLIVMVKYIIKTLHEWVTGGIKIQVFMPYPDFYLSTHCLDSSRLGNQIYRECKTLINDGWKNHPAYTIWKDYKYALCNYALVGLFVLVSERNKYYPKWIDYFIEKQQGFKDTGLPSIFGYKPYHDSHKSNLLRKNPEYYSQFNWKVPNNLPYVWKIEE